MTRSTHQERRLADLQHALERAEIALRYAADTGKQVSENDAIAIAQLREKMNSNPSAVHANDEGTFWSAAACISKSIGCKDLNSLAQRYQYGSVTKIDMDRLVRNYVVGLTLTLALTILVHIDYAQRDASIIRAKQIATNFDLAVLKARETQPTDVEKIAAIRREQCSSVGGWLEEIHYQKELNDRVTDPYKLWNLVWEGTKWIYASATGNKELADIPNLDGQNNVQATVTLESSEKIEAVYRCDSYFRPIATDILLEIEGAALALSGIRQRLGKVAEVNADNDIKTSVAKMQEAADIAIQAIDKMELQFRSDWRDTKAIVDTDMYFLQYKPSNPNVNADIASNPILEKAKDAQSYSVSSSESQEKFGNHKSDLMFSSGLGLGSPESWHIFRESERIQQIHITFILPLLYGILGAAASVLVAVGQDIDEIRFVPTSRIHYKLRIALGAVVGATAGLILSPDTLASWTGVTTIGLAFGLGCVADSLIIKLRALIDRLMSALNSSDQQSGTR